MKNLRMSKEGTHPHSSYMEEKNIQSILVTDSNIRQFEIPLSSTWFDSKIE